MRAGRDRPAGSGARPLLRLSARAKGEIDVVSALEKSPLPFLRVQNLKTHFPVERGFLFKQRVGSVRAVDGVSFDLRQGEILGLVGESGCGKSTLGRTILQLIRPTEGVVV